MLSPLALVQKPLEGINKGELVADAYIPADRFGEFCHGRCACEGYHSAIKGNELAGSSFKVKAARQKS